MEKEYYLSLNLKTPKGIEPYGRFDIGRDKKFALGLFDGLAGVEESTGRSVLHFDLTESENGVPFVLNVKYCTLDELAKNTKRITFELFKHRGLAAGI